MTLYFAYGANLDAEHMAGQCPGAVERGRAELPEHDFAIAARGYGSAVPAPGRALPGLLWELSLDDEAALDRFEGVPEGMYVKTHALVRRENGELVRAMLYQPSDPRPGTRVAGYLERIIVVAEQRGFPVEYVERLKQGLGPRA